MASSEDASGILGFISLYRKALSEFGVVVLGSFVDGDKQILLKLKAVCESKGLQVIIMNSVEDMKYETPRQKIYSVLSNVKFVIAEDSKASGEIVELEYCRNIGVITAILSKDNIRSSWMTWDFAIHSNDFRVFDYTSSKTKHLSKVLDRITKWVETRRKIKRDQMKKLYQKMKKKEQEKTTLSKLGIHTIKSK